MDKVTLNFTANNQALSIAEAYYFASNTVSYIEAAFDLGDNWTGFDSVRAVWSTNTQHISTLLDGSGKCLVPQEVLTRCDKVKVNLVGSIVENNELTDRLTTYPVVAIVVNAFANVSGTETAPVTPSQFEQYVAQVEALVGTVKDIDSVTLNADYTLTIYFSDGTDTTVGPIRGEQGPQGETGPQGPKGPTGNGIASISKTGTAGLVDTYTITMTNGSTFSFNVTNGEDGEITADNLIETLQDELAEYSVSKGNYAEDSVPYLFRQSGGGVLVGVRSLSQIVGGTVAWNQLVASGALSFTVPSGHKYYSSINGTKTIASSNGSAISINDSTKDNAIDLTAALGTTIADYVYTLESGTAGAGVAKLKEWGFLTEPYYAYDAGSLQSVCTSKHITTGFNQWDEELEGGSIGITTGQNIANISTTRSKNYIPIVPNTQYCFLLPWAYIFWYDANKNFISYSANFVTEDGNIHQKLLVSPANAYYCRFRNSGTYGTTYKNDICINLSLDGSRNGEYEPYVKHEYAVDPVVLRGRFYLDANNNLMCDGDVYPPSGEVQRKYVESSFNGSENGWSIAATGTNRIFRLNNAFSVSIVKASLATYRANWAMPTTVISGMENNGLGEWTFRTTDSATANYDLLVSTPTASVGMTLDEFKAKLTNTPLVIVAEKSTPTTETATPYSATQVIDPLGTEQRTDYEVEQGTRDVAIPVGHNTKYPPDDLGKLDMLANVPAPPTANGTYQLEVTVSGGKATYLWA